MLRITVNNEVSDALRAYSEQLERRLVQTAGTAAQMVVGRAVGSYMRDAKGEPARRRPDDNGPLRIVTGRLLRSLIGARFGSAEPESIYRIKTISGEVQVTFGSKTPYAAIHEFGGFAGRGHLAYIPGRPYLGPSIADESGEIVNLFDQELTALAKELDL